MGPKFGLFIICLYPINFKAGQPIEPIF